MKTLLFRSIVFAALLFCGLLICSCKKAEPSILVDLPVTDEPDRSLPYQYPDWMAGIPDSMKLSQLTLPGTHDCGADNHSGGVPSGSHWDVVCHDFRFSNQLLLGVRWFDVRYDNVDTKLHHGGFVLSRHLEDIIDDAISFLGNHPSEAIVFLIKKEYGGSTDATFSDKVWEVLQKYSQDHFYLNDNLPSLGEVRGKIVIASHDNTNGNGHILGPEYTWPDNTSLHFGNTTNFHYYAQDHYSISYVSYDVKSNEVRHLIDISYGYPDPNRVDLNYTSAERDAVATSIKEVAENINGNINNYLTVHPDWRHCGVLMLNYAGGSDDGNCNPNLVQLIIQHNDFETTKIGTQTWMGFNLNVTKYRNGNPIPKVNDFNTWITLTTGAYCDYANDENNSVKYGRLYNWYAVTDPRGLAPAGWHVPSDMELKTLVDSLGGSNVAGGHLKQIGTINWGTPNTGADNSSLFNALPAGWASGVDDDSEYWNIGLSCCLWSSTSYNSTDAWYNFITFDNSNVLRASENKRFGFSVRCVKN
jgi:uncharacterized protein (TIGR02145 family)